MFIIISSLSQLEYICTQRLQKRIGLKQAATHKGLKINSKPELPRNNRKRDILSKNINSDLYNLYYEEKVQQIHEIDILKTFAKKWTDIRTKLTRLNQRLSEDQSRIKTLEDLQQQLLKRGRGLVHITKTEESEIHNHDLKTNANYFAAKDALKKYKDDIETREEELIAAEMKSMKGEIPDDVLNLTRSESAMREDGQRRKLPVPVDLGHPPSTNDQLFDGTLDHLRYNVADDVKRYYIGWFKLLL